MMPAPKGSKFNKATGKYEMPKASKTPPSKRVPDVPTGRVPEAVDYSTEGVRGRPAPDSKKTEPLSEEEEFVTEEEVKERFAPKPIPKTEGKMPQQPGFIVDMVAGLGQKIHETEYGLTGHPVFQHGPADERIWKGLGAYVESQVDPAKWGILILCIVLVGSEAMKIGVYASSRLPKKAKTPAGRKPLPPPNEPSE
jgi:hypothetical protein